MNPCDAAEQPEQIASVFSHQELAILLREGQLITNQSTIEEIWIDKQRSNAVVTEPQVCLAEFVSQFIG